MNKQLVLSLLLTSFLCPLYPSFQPDHNESQATQTKQIESTDDQQGILDSMGEWFNETIDSMTSSNPCPPFTGETELERELRTIIPAIHIEKQLPEDKILLDQIRPLFFEKVDRNFFQTMANALFNIDYDKSWQNNVYQKSINEYGGQEVMLLTEDNLRISTLQFIRKDAPLNIIYVTGYFGGQTPPKEWAAPFAPLYKEFNSFSLDWRGFSSSDGYASEFGLDAYKDIQAVIDHVRSLNDKPIVLVGFCFGGAMALRTTQIAQENGHNLADALVLNCTPNNMQDLIRRAAAAAPNWALQKFFSYQWTQDHILSRMAGEVFTPVPLEIIKTINLPIYFEYYTKDGMVPLEEGIKNYIAARGPKMFCMSDCGRHVRLHSKVPYQYRQSFLTFLKSIDLISQEQYSELSKPPEGLLKS